MAHSSNDKETALFEAVISPDKTLVGSRNIKHAMLEINNINHTLFMVKFMQLLKKI